MSAVTQLETIKNAKNPHRCSWCSERIDVGQPYKRYRYYNYSDAVTVKLHPECYDAMKEAHANEGADFEFSPGDNPR